LTDRKNAEVTGFLKHLSVAQSVHLRFLASKRTLGGSREAMTSGSSMDAT